VEQRSEARIKVESLVVVDVLGESGFRLEAEVVNISSSGMGLLAHCPIEPEAALRIHLDGDLYLAEVTHCVLEAGYFHIGVSLFNVMRNAAAVSQRLNRVLQAR
jgi:hypothetical protein